MSWNPVLNLFLEIKNKIPEEKLWEYEDGTCLKYWAELLNDPYYNNILNPLKINECGNFLLIRYNNYPKLFADKETGKIKYDEFWNLYNGLYRECRSVVIDKRKECLVLTPFKKFFNINEIPETSMKQIQERISKAFCVEFSDKLDGSMQSARYYNGQIVMSGSQAVDPSQSWRLRDGYSRLTENHRKMIEEHPDLTFIFEYISQRDAHVVKYKEEGMFLVGIRNTENGIEFRYSEILHYADFYHVPTTKVFDKTLDEVIAELDDKPADEAEGFVLNIDGYKVKIKYNDYVGINRVIKHACSTSTIIEYFAEDKLDDLFSKIPASYHDTIMDTVKFLDLYNETIDDITTELFVKAPKDDRKEFMVWVEGNAPKEARAYIRNLYFGKQNNYFKRRGGYLKIKELEKRLESLQQFMEGDYYADYQ